MGSHRKRLKRHEEPGEGRYLTFSCYGRLPLFRNDAIKEVFVDHLALTTRRLDLTLLAWVVMPEHVHLLILPDVSRITVPRVLMALKRPVAEKVLGRWRQLDATILQRVTDRSGNPHFWQAGGGYDRNIYSDEELLQKIDYIHNNPVRRGLVSRPTDWPWSSARWYEKMPYEGPAITSMI